MKESKDFLDKPRIKGGWRDRIFDMMVRCKEAGREPILLVICPTVFSELYREIFPLGEYYSLWKASQGEVTTYFGIDVILNSRIKDFRVIDDRSWAEQTWEEKK